MKLSARITTGHTPPAAPFSRWPPALRRPLCLSAQLTASAPAPTLRRTSRRAEKRHPPDTSARLGGRCLGGFSLRSNLAFLRITALATGRHTAPAYCLRLCAVCRFVASWAENQKRYRPPVAGSFGFFKLFRTSRVYVVVAADLTNKQASLAAGRFSLFSSCQDNLLSKRYFANV